MTERPARGTYVHDLRHRYSYELRPAATLDRSVRALAMELERDGLLEAGATQAPRFHPHLTLLRADVGSRDAAMVIAGPVASDVTFTAADAFGEGRIPYLVPADSAVLGASRHALVELLGSDHVDPLVHERAWTPHLTVAYAVPAEHRQPALERIRERLPLVGRWATLEVWDLDVRPTVLVARVELDR